MRRREFLALAGAAALPLGAHDAQSAPKRLGVLIGYAQNDPEAQARVAAFRDGLRQAGWEDGRNIQISYYWAGASPDRYEPLASELLKSQPDVILANTTPVTAVLQRQTRSIPIVFVVVSDPVGAGFVASLPRPGGNITGFINFEAAMGGKWLELLKDVAPNVMRVGLMHNPSTAPGGGNYFRPSFEAAAPKLGVAPVTSAVRSPADIESTIIALAGQPGGGLVVSTDSFLTVHRKVIIRAAERHKLPVAYPLGLFAKEGGLIGYGPDYHDMFRRSASYVDRILRGAKPQELPVQVPTKFELVLNLRAAKSLGLTVAREFLLRTDEVIE
jgi:putative ABC transport system substrate-binding protein